jgi:hypothetical protein
MIGTAQEQLGILIGDQSVPATYALILAVRCPRCGSGAGIRCKAASTGKPTYPHTARAQDAVSAVAYFLKASPQGAR